MVVSVNQVANYYDVSKKTIETVILRNREEFEDDGMVVLKGEEFKDFISKICDSNNNIIYTASNTSKKIYGENTAYIINSITTVARRHNDTIFKKVIRNVLCKQTTLSNMFIQAFSYQIYQSSFIRSLLLIYKFFVCYFQIFFPQIKIYLSGCNLFVPQHF